MIALLSSLKADLLGRRLLPLVVLAGVALVGAIGYAVLGGSSGTQTHVISIASSTPSPAGGAAIARPAPESTDKAISETTSGVKDQRSGPSRNPFKQLPFPKEKAKAADSSGGSSPSKSSSSGSSGSSGGGTAPSTPSTPVPAKPKPKQPTYQVAVLFGQLPAPGENPKLTPFADLKRLTPLPAPKGALLVFSGVGRTGKGAIFTLLAPAIIKGNAICLPSPSQCEAIDVRAGQTEELDYLKEDGTTVGYELQVVSIAKRNTSKTASVRHAARISRAGRWLLHKAHLAVSAQLRYSPARDVVVFTK